MCVAAAMSWGIIQVVLDTINEDEKKTAQLERRRLQDFADRTIDGVFYVKDSRAGKCFALGCREGQFASVSCDGIPPELLITARIKPGSPAPVETK